MSLGLPVEKLSQNKPELEPEIVCYCSRTSTHETWYCGDKPISHSSLRSQLGQSLAAPHLLTISHSPLFTLIYYLRLY